MPDSDELWQAYDEQGEPITDKGLTKPQARSGILHGASHAWVWRGAGNEVEILLQKRAGASTPGPAIMIFSWLVNKKLPGKRIVPHDKVYFANLLKEIARGSGEGEYQLL
jgi:hypothetical protein